MNIKIKHEGNSTIFYIDGDLDCFSISKLKKAFTGEQAEEARDFMIDLTDVAYLDSSAIGYLVKMNNIMRNNGKKLTLTNPKKEIMQLLKVTYIDKMLNVLPSSDDRAD